MTTEPNYVVGIDTGGTYTDVAILEAGSNLALATAKRQTTHWDLSLGVSRGLEAVLQASGVDPAQIGALSVSTTLATNAVVEGHGARVGCIILGNPKRLALPGVTTKYVDGGHVLNGREEKPLAIESLMHAVGDMIGRVEAYAVCGAMSIVNPTHELVAAKSIELMDNKPVFLSHLFSDLPGIAERAATTALNAQLMPLMQVFVDGVRRSLRDLGLAGSLSIVRGDGRPMPVADAIDQAAATFASGPAATALYGAVVSPAPHALVVDVGGTTTDVTMVRDGQPLVATGGSRIGDWDTHVESVVMHTAGVGGDSHARVSNALLLVGPSRVLPLCMAEGLPDPASWLGPELRSACVVLRPLKTEPAVEHKPIVDFLANHGPTSARVLKDELGMAEMVLLKQLDELARRHMVYEVGFTPTDALHALGRLELGDAKISLSGANALAPLLQKTPEGFCEQVLTRAHEEIEAAIVKLIVEFEIGQGRAGLIDLRRRMRLLDLRFATPLPIVGLGAAAKTLLPGVAERLQTDVAFPKDYAAGNALGAALAASR